MMWVVVEFQPGDRGEWESIERVTGPFVTEETAYEWSDTAYLAGGGLSVNRHRVYAVAIEVEVPE
jgi:hypothetical protein